MHYKQATSDNQISSGDVDSAQAIAVNALEYLANDGELLSRFVAISGIEPEQMREAARERGFLVGVLDFFLAHEPTLMTFAQSADIAPEHIANARHVLEPSGFDFA